jgi:hypothetical protein
VTLREKEAPPIWGVAQHVQHLEKLLKPKVIGFYNSFEVTEILGYHADARQQPVNFFTLLVAEPSAPPDEIHPVFLNEKRISLPGTKWQFGVVRYRVPTQLAIAALQKFDTNTEWSPNGIQVKVGAMAAVPPQFVATDGPEPHPWNSLLKNNHWEGSHVLELFDRTKTEVKFLLEEPRLLKKLAEEIRSVANIGIDGLSDRVGNIVIQLPVTVLSTILNSYDSDGAFGIQPVWHPSVAPRLLRITCEKYEDTTIEGFDSKDVATEMAQFSVTAPGGGARYVLWDDANKVILGASAKTLFFTSVGFGFHSTDLYGNARTFLVHSKNGVTEMRIPVSLPSKPSIVGSSPFKPHEPWRSRRIFSNSLHELKERKEFVQYGGKSGIGREQALKDIHFLLRKHGEFGAWLWDPYLDANDILETLFYNGHGNADLRALSAGMLPPPTNNLKKKKSQTRPWKEVQNNTLNFSKGNGYGLRLEYRVRMGHAGWDFHDRFLIFPSATGGATAWSLGTSINSLGHKHHILQKVQDGELIRQAFLDLWDALEDEDYLVWKNV